MKHNLLEDPLKSSAANEKSQNIPNSVLLSETPLDEEQLRRVHIMHLTRREMQTAARKSLPFIALWGSLSLVVCQTRSPCQWYTFPVKAVFPSCSTRKLSD